MSVPDRISEAAVSPFTSADVAEILCRRGWLAGAPPPGDSPLNAWLAHAAQLLGPHASDRDALTGLLALVFDYNVAEIAQRINTHAVVVREGGREVIRALGHLVLSGGPVDSDRFKEIVNALKATLPHRGRSLFFPIRLALAGRAGDGGLDRVILLLDAAAQLPFATRVKGTRERMLEFCAALD